MKSVLLACISFAILYGVCAEQTVFNFTHGENTFLERLDLTMKIEYYVSDNKTKIATLELPQNATVDDTMSRVADTEAMLVLVFGPLNVYNITQNFRSNYETFSMTSMEIGVTFDNQNFPDAIHEGVVLNFGNLGLFNTSVGKSYQCDAAIHVKEDTDYDDSKGSSLMFSNMQLQPFGVKNKTFSEAEHCAEDMASSPSGQSTELTTELTTNAPTPAPPHSDDVWNFTKDGHTCILMSTNVHFKVKEDNKTTFYELVNATVDSKKSSCGDATNKTNAVLWVNKGRDFFVQTFGTDGKNFFLYKLEMNITTAGKAHHFNVTLNDNSTFETPIGDSWKCVSNVTIDSGEKKQPMVEISYTYVTLQPYNITHGNFSKNFVCAEDNAISNIVPIAVGCALAVLVIIVLIAYLIGRRNSSRSGYESV